MIIKWLGVGLLLGFCSLLLSEAGFKGKRVFAALGGVILICALSGEIGQAVSQILGFAEGAGIGEGARCASKIVGAGYLFGIGADVLAELGESGVSRALIAAGKIEILLIVMPYFVDILELGLSLLK